MDGNKCKECNEVRKGKKKAIRFKKKKAICAACGKKVSKVLDLHHTGADLCSLECERNFWLDLLD